MDYPLHNLGRIWSILTDLTENSIMQPSAPALHPFVSLLSKLDQYCSNGVVKILTKNHPKIHEKYQVLSQIWTLNTKCHKIMVGQSERKYRRFWISNHIFENKFPRYDSIFTILARISALWMNISTTKQSRTYPIPED